MSSEKALRFLEKHGMSPDGIDPAREAAKMAEEMALGLAGKGGSLPMIPTYLSDAGQIPLNEPVVVIDAGGDYQMEVIRAAEEIIGDTGVSYLNLLPWEGIDDQFPAQYIPTTYFVDANGNIVGETAVGSRGADDYEALIEEALAAAGQ